MVVKSGVVHSMGAWLWFHCGDHIVEDVSFGGFGSLDQGVGVKINVGLDLDVLWFDLNVFHLDLDVLGLNGNVALGSSSPFTVSSSEK